MALPRMPSMSRLSAKSRNDCVAKSRVIERLLEWADGRPGAQERELSTRCRPSFLSIWGCKADIQTTLQVLREFVRNSVQRHS